RGCPVVALDLFVRVMPFEKDNGLPSPGVKLGINAFRFRAHLVQEILVPFNIGSARSTDLHQGKSSLKGWILFKEPLNRSESFQNSFCVIHTVHTHAEKRSLYS